MLSAQTKYALRALIYLAENAQDNFVKVDEIAKATNVPSPYLSKILKQLAYDELIDTRKGPSGGAKSSQRYKDLTFFEVCEALEDPVIGKECILFRAECNKEDPCPFHTQWSGTREKFIQFLKKSKVNQTTKKLP